ncbi:hypothetical protein ZWY2020_000299 [Hordeum vulgare]|nr:hypothetical protein ZWY2020_000299 [Hordeum vulgare]
MIDRSKLINECVRMEVETGICDLPADCLARVGVTSLTSPGDACRLAATAAVLREAADSDEVWGSIIPADCADILARRSTSDERRREGETNKRFFSRLCERLPRSPRCRQAAT